MKPVTLGDLARRYGYFLDHLYRGGEPLSNGRPAGQVTAENVASYLAELQGRVGTVTIYGSIYKLRRLAELLDPRRDFGWLREIESDLEFLKQPKSKLSRRVDGTALVEAGLTLLEEAELASEVSPFRSIALQNREARRRAGGAADQTELSQAVLARNGLMVALLALCPIRLKNFAALEVGQSFLQIDRSWWIVVEPEDAKTGRTDERPVPALLTPHIDRYLQHHRMILSRGRLAADVGSLWLSRSGNAMTYSGLQAVICRATEMALGVSVSPHMFRASAATTAAVRAPCAPGLASALLQHVDPRVTEQHYNRATAHDAAKAYAALVEAIKDGT